MPQAISSKINNNNNNNNNFEIKKYWLDLTKFLSRFLTNRANHDRESGDYAGSISDLQSVTSRLSTVSVSIPFSPFKSLFSMCVYCVRVYIT